MGRGRSWLPKARSVWLTKSTAPSACCWQVRSTEVNTPCAAAPLAVRLPPDTLRLTTAGPTACSPTALVGGTASSDKNENHDANWLARCAGNVAYTGNTRRRWTKADNRSSKASRAPSHAAGAAARRLLVAPMNGLGEQPDHLPREVDGAACRPLQPFPRPPQDVEQALLVDRRREAVVRREASVDQRPFPIPADHGFHNVGTAAGIDRITGRAVTDPDVQPRRPAAQPPARLVQPQLVGVRNLLDNLLVSRRQACGGSRHDWALRARLRSMPNRASKVWAILPWGRPLSVLSATTAAWASGPSWLAAAPVASEVCKGGRPWTRRRH